MKVVFREVPDRAKEAIDWGEKESKKTSFHEP